MITLIERQASLALGEKGKVGGGGRVGQEGSLQETTGPVLLGLVLCPLKQRTVTARHGLGRAVKTLSNASHIHPKRTNAGIKKDLE